MSAKKTKGKGNNAESRGKFWCSTEQEERLLLDAFRGIISSQHSRNAVLIMLADMGWGPLTELADRHSLRGLLRDMGVRHG